MSEHGNPIRTPHNRDRMSMDSAVAVAAYVAALDVASEVQLAAVLQRLVDLARAVVPSGYAALGVSDEYGHITEFITSGISTLERARIGPIPQGHGMLGALIHDRTPLLIERIADDPRSVGFPAHHPPMQSLLGVPILLGDRVLGDLYLTERLENRAYDAADLEAVQILAAHAASAIDRAQLFSQVESNRRRAEDERDQLQVILDSFPSGVIIQTAPDGLVELANATALEMTGTPGEWASDNRQLHFSMLRPDGRTLPKLQWPGMRALGGEIVRNRQLLLSNKNGEDVPVLVQAVPLRNRRGDVERAVVVMQDITRLREAEQLKDDFLSLVSHEFRTPLTAIHGGALLLAQQSDALDAETRQSLVNDIVYESARLEQMLANILTLTSLQAGRIDPLNEPILVSAIVREASTVAHKKSPDHEFVSDIPKSLPLAEGDRDLLIQVLSNLYENAVKYSQPGTTVTTSASASERDVSISILDQGSGIAPENLGSVFERFRRPGADPSVRGMGLGLYLSRHLIEAQGGRIDVASAGVNAGSTFRITLPISADWLQID
ncbi:MAG: ATP-binding protein [Thermomicrobiales bacterium]